MAWPLIPPSLRDYISQRGHGLRAYMATAVVCICQKTEEKRGSGCWSAIATFMTSRLIPVTQTFFTPQDSSPRPGGQLIVVHTGTAFLVLILSGGIAVFPILRTRKKYISPPLVAECGTGQ